VMEYRSQDGSVRVIKGVAKRAVSGTRLEPMARQLWRKATGLPPEERDAAYDRQAFEVMRRVVAPSSCCVDVGAYAGKFIREMVHLAPRGSHYAVEPLPHRAEWLREAFPTVQVLETALAEESGRLQFRHVLGDDEGFSGFFRRPYDTYEERVEMISVEVGRLDDVLPEDLQPRFIKVDVEGSEARVFRGGVETLARSQPYVAFESGWGHEASYEVLVEGAGLGISLLSSWLAGRRPLSRDEFLDEVGSSRNYFFLAHPAAP
jgi:FkbM family methyltransferase